MDSDFYSKDGAVISKSGDKKSPDTNINISGKYLGMFIFVVWEKEDE